MNYIYIPKFILLTFTFTLLLSCGGPKVDYNYQVFNLSDCIVCQNPFKYGASDVEELVSSLYSVKNEYGENTDVLDGWLIFDDIPIVNPPAGKIFSFFQIPFYYNSSNCYFEPRRRGNLRVTFFQWMIEENSKNSWDLFLRSKDGDKFDLFLLYPEFEFESASHACDGFTFSITDYKGIFLGPKEVIMNGKFDEELMSRYSVLK